MVKIKQIKQLLKTILGERGARLVNIVYKSLVTTKQAQSELGYINQVLQYIIKGDVVLDIGANVGLWAIQLSKKVTNTGRVYAFEPMKSTFRELEKRTSKFPNIILQNLGVSDRIGAEIILFDPVAITPLGATIARTANHLNKSERFKEATIQIDTLDNMFSDFTENIKFIKVDVEGHELQVVQGAFNFISKHKPIFFIEILREYWIDGMPVKSKVANLLCSMGYKMSQVHEEMIVDDQNRFDTMHENFLFRPK